MILKEKNLQNFAQANSSQTEHSPTNLISKEALLRRLRRGPKARAQFVRSHLDKSIAYQTRALRDREKWTQREFAEKLGITHPNNVSSRLENPNYGSQSLNTLKNIAETCDVALVVWFIPFSRMLNWVTGTPSTDNGLSEDFYSIPAFTDEFEGRNRADQGTVPDFGCIEGGPPRKSVQRVDEDDEGGELGHERLRDTNQGAAKRSWHEKGLAAQAGD